MDYDPLPDVTARRHVARHLSHPNGGTCEDCGTFCPTLVDLAEHYAPTSGGTPACPMRRTNAHQPID